MQLPPQYWMDLQTYFAGHPVELSLYARLAAQLDEALPQTQIKVQKSQISFYNPRLFAAASIPVRRKKDWPKTCLLVTFGLGHRLDDPRIAVCTEPYPNRWVHHVVVSSPEEIDGQLLDWVRQADAFARQK